MERIRQKYGSKLWVQLDIFHRDLVRRHPERFYAEEEWPAPTRVAECVTPLVVEADGTVVPLGYGFARQYSLGRLPEQRLRDMGPCWLTTRYSEFRDLCRRVYAEACKPSHLPFLNWYELIGLRSADLAG